MGTSISVSARRAKAIRGYLFGRSVQRAATHGSVGMPAVWPVMVAVYGGGEAMERRQLQRRSQFDPAPSRLPSNAAQVIHATEASLDLTHAALKLLSFLFLVLLWLPFEGWQVLLVLKRL